MATGIVKLLALVLLASASLAHAQVYKCADKEGKVAYQAEPCPVAATETRLKDLALSPSTNRLPLKDGWSEMLLAAITEGCIVAVMEPARRDFNAAAMKSGGEKMSRMLEADFRASVDGMCSCIARRLGTTFTLSQVERGGKEPFESFAREAMEGGQCKPRGIMGRVIDRAARR